jgi:hypothetical protein
VGTAGGQALLRRGERALAACAMEHDPARAIRRQLLRIKRGQWIEQGTLDALGSKLGRLAHVNQQQLACLEEPGDLGGVEGVYLAFMVCHRSILQEMLLESAGRWLACRSASSSNHMAFRIAKLLASPRPNIQLKYHTVLPSRQ